MARSLAQSGVRRAASLVAAVAALLVSAVSIRLTGADAVDPRAVAPATARTPRSLPVRAELGLSGSAGAWLKSPVAPQ